MQRTSALSVSNVSLGSNSLKRNLHRKSVGSHYWPSLRMVWPGHFSILDSESRGQKVHMSKKAHMTPSYRLAQILVKLNQGEKLDPTDLAKEFGVNLRTIQRDPESDLPTYCCSKRMAGITWSLRFWGSSAART